MPIMLFHVGILSSDKFLFIDKSKGTVWGFEKRVLCNTVNKLFFCLRVLACVADIPSCILLFFLLLFYNSKPDDNIQHQKNQL